MSVPQREEATGAGEPAEPPLTPPSPEPPGHPESPAPVEPPRPLDRRDPATLGRLLATGRVWYAAYGSNLHLARLTCYLAGGRPPGGRLVYPGCRDPRPPEHTRPITLPGELYFALESRAWTGGTAFYDPDGAGHTAARAYLVTAGQFADVAAQEMHRPPGTDLALDRVLAAGREALGPGRYETLVCAGELAGHPVLTFTAPWRRTEVPGNPPVADYLRHLAAGLAESHRWTGQRIADYLATRPGAAGHWSPEAVAALLPR